MKRSWMTDARRTLWALAVTVLAMILLALVLERKPDPQRPRPLVLHCADPEPHPRGSWPVDMDRDTHAALNLRCSEIPPQVRVVC